MEKFNRMMAVVALTVGFGAGALYGAQSDVENVFDNLRYGDFTNVILTELTPREIVSARSNDGDTLIIDAVLSYGIAQYKAKSPAAGQKDINAVITHFIGLLKPQARRDLLDVTNKKGQTALMLAAQKGLTETVNILHKYGSAGSVLKKDKQGKRASDVTRLTTLKNLLKKWEKEAEALLGDTANGQAKSDLEKDWHLINPEKD